MRLIDAENIRIKPEFMHDICGMAMIRVEDVVRILNEQPTIHSEPHWIPVTERLPEKTGRYLAWAVVSFIPDHVDEPNTIKQIAIASYSTRTRTWFGDNVEDVIAWMPLPKVFKENEHESN